MHLTYVDGGWRMDGGMDGGREGGREGGKEGGRTRAKFSSDKTNQKKTFNRAIYLSVKGVSGTSCA